MNDIPDSKLNEFTAAARRVAGYGLVVCGSGNLSWRIGDDLMLITATSSWMDRLDPSGVAACRISDMAPLNGVKPSKEIGFHAGVFRERPEVNVVLHFQSPAATTLACRETEVQDFWIIPEMPYYIGPVAMVPFLHPGSRELADAVVAALKDHEMTFLRNHGLVTVGSDLDEATANAAYFELACKVVLGAGPQLRPMPEEASAALRREGAARRGAGRCPAKPSP